MGLNVNSACSSSMMSFLRLAFMVPLADNLYPRKIGPPGWEIL